jgi:hypothetical protein
VKKGEENYKLSDYKLKKEEKNDNSNMKKKNKGLIKLKKESSYFKYSRRNGKYWKRKKKRTN